MKESVFNPPPRPAFNSVTFSFWLFLVLLVVSLVQLEGPVRSVDPVRQFLVFARDFFPPDISILPRVLAALWETIQIATIATACGAVLALFVGVMGARGISPNWLVTLTRMGLNGIRTLPSLLWALLAVAMFGVNPLAGVVALTFYALGYLGKFFSETLEAADFTAMQSLRRLGASRWQAVQYGLWPAVRSQLWSQVLWMLEYNIRSASIIGYVGAGGIGLQLLRYQEFGQWDRFGMVLICIFVLVIGLDGLSSRVRRRLAKSSTRATTGG